MNHSKSEASDCNADLSEALIGLLAAAKQVRDPMYVYCGIPSHFTLKKLDEAILKAELTLKSAPTASRSAAG